MKLICNVIFFLSLLFSACVCSGKEYSPKLIPGGWVENYGYQSSLKSYLKRQYELASQMGQRTYVYLYSDWSKDCRNLRRLLKQNRFNSAFNGKRIVMLDIAKLRKQQGIKNRSNHNQKRQLAVWSPLITAVNGDGEFHAKYFYPGIYLAHDAFTDEYRARNQTTSILPRAQPKNEFLRELRNYFAVTEFE